MPASRPSTPHPSRIPYPPLTWRNLACYLLLSHEHLDSHDCPTIEVGSSTKVPSSWFTITDPGQAYTLSPSERMLTKENQYPMGYIWQTQVAVCTCHHFRNVGPPPLCHLVIWYNDLPNWNRTPSPAPAYNTDDPNPPFMNAWGEIIRTTPHSGESSKNVSVIAGAEQRGWTLFSQ